MTGILMVAIAGLAIGFSVAAKKFERWDISAPMVFLAVGAVVYGLVSELSIADSGIQKIAEITLVVVLFHDASSVRATSLRNHPGLPVRLLLIGFPLMLVATFGATLWILPGVGIAGAVLISGLLTPTDAGLGAPTILNPAVPNRIRRALNVESGLNDGLATPIVLIALGVLSAEEGETLPPVAQIAVVPVGLAIVLAILVGLSLAWLLDQSKARGLSSRRGRSIVVLALPLFLLGAAEIIGANGFITAFIGGIAFGSASTCLHEEREASVLLETSADLMSMVVWFLAGGLVVTVFSVSFDWRWLVLAVLALSVLRAGSVAISLIGSGLQFQSVLFVSWFGPRGLATIVFALLAVEELGTDSSLVLDVVGVALTTVVLSVFAHGISAEPLAERFGRWSRAHSLEKPHPELAPTRTRGRHAIMHTK